MPEPDESSINAVVAQSPLSLLPMNR
ncbi:hypothetical protein THIARS_70892 [Thiomonas delicata]|uniref:Uncharacterized protein n=1 Tax=Thiomonas delicata TaxID=364030 RepID=A0A238D7X7_THIDL|nr:hypothetical protein THIARS_70892 [Thiomonas delicata]